MKIQLEASGSIDGRSFTGAIESRLLIKDRLRVQIIVDDHPFILNSVMSTLETEHTLNNLTNGGKITIEIPDDAECNAQEIREALEATFSDQD